MTPGEAMQRIDAALSHVWMVRQFLKHCDEAQEDDELMAIPRALYDVLLAVGPAWRDQNADAYLHIVRKKFARLRRTAELFEELQPEVSTHTNFQMAVRSLNEAVRQIGRLLDQVAGDGASHTDRGRSAGV